MKWLTRMSGCVLHSSDNVTGCMARGSKFPFQFFASRAINGRPDSPKKLSNFFPPRALFGPSLPAPAFVARMRPSNAEPLNRIRDKNVSHIDTDELSLLWFGIDSPGRAPQNRAHRPKHHLISPFRASLFALHPNQI